MTLPTTLLRLIALVSASFRSSSGPFCQAILRQEGACLKVPSQAIRQRWRSECDGTARDKRKSAPGVARQWDVLKEGAARTSLARRCRALPSILGD